MVDSVTGGAAVAEEPDAEAGVGAPEIGAEALEGATGEPVQPVARTRFRPVPADDPQFNAPGVVPDKSEINDLLGKLAKAHGPHLVRRASIKPPFVHIPLGIFTLDIALLGGFPEGLVSSLVGWESSGKTTIAIRAAGAAQRKHPDMTVAYLDVEGTFDPEWATCHGVDCDKLLLIQPSSGEQALDVAADILKARETCLLVVDSLPALVPMKEIEASFEDQQVGLQARLIGKFLRVVNQAMLDERRRGHWPTLLTINQWRMKIGVVRGDPRTINCGVAQKFINSVFVEITNKETLGKDGRDNEVADYNEHAFRIRKNKIGNSFKTGEFTMVRNPDHSMGQGFIDDGKTVVTYLKKFGLVTGGGSSWRLDGVDHKFGRLQEIVDMFYADAALYTHYQHRLISMQRAAMGRIAGNWY